MQMNLLRRCNMVGQSYVCSNISWYQKAVSSPNRRQKCYSNLSWLDNDNRPTSTRWVNGTLLGLGRPNPISCILMGKCLLGRYFYTQRTQSKRTWRTSLLRVLKGICLVTGAGFWVGLIVVLFMVEDVTVKKSDHDVTLDQESMLRTLKFYGILKNESWSDADGIVKPENADNVREEVKSKEFALSSVWEKLRNEEGVQLTFGKTVQISGYKCGETDRRLDQTVANLEDGNVWNAHCFIEGLNGKAGLLSIMFERANANSEWVPTRVYLEIVKESGDIVCNVSGHLPNGLKNFTRLSNQ